MNRDLAQLSNRIYDLVIVGGGVHGACAAWDATLRGLTVALIERGDFGQATSANSLKTVHGGLRYLQDADLMLVRRMIHERKSYLRIAPHLVHPMPCLMPTYNKLMKNKLVMGAALKINDLMGFDRNQDADPQKRLPNGRVVSRKEFLRLLPGICTDGVTGGVLWYDAQVFNTERFTLAFVKSAVQAGAVAANYVEATGFLQNGGKVVGVKAKDILTGEELDIRGKMVLNAAGPWVDIVLDRLKGQRVDPKFNHSLAMNLVTRKFIHEYGAGIPSRPDRMGTDSGIKRSRLLFVAPWRDYSIVGTFHAYYQGNPDEFTVSEEDLGKFITETNSAYPGAQLKREDIVFIHKGFLPAENSDDLERVKLVRQGQVYDHQKEDGIEGLITMVGVKYTSARHVARQAIDRVFVKLGRSSPECKTDYAPIKGGEIERLNDFLSRAQRDGVPGLDEGHIRSLVFNYGAEYPQLLRFMPPGSTLDPGQESFSAIVRAQVLYAIRCEMAQTLADVLLRRTDIGSAGKPQDALIQLCAEVMADELGWDEEKKETEIQAVSKIYSTVEELQNRR